MSLPIFAFIISQERRIYFKNIYRLFISSERCSGNWKNIANGWWYCYGSFRLWNSQNTASNVFRLPLLETWWQVSKKKQYIRDGRWWISDMSNSGVKHHEHES